MILVVSTDGSPVSPETYIICCGAALASVGVLVGHFETERGLYLADFLAVFVRLVVLGVCHGCSSLFFFLFADLARDI
jgi:hypothetical protein